jgi:hypothetical protein
MHKEQSPQERALSESSALMRQKITAAIPSRRLFLPAVPYGLHPYGHG